MPPLPGAMRGVTQATHAEQAKQARQGQAGERVASNLAGFFGQTKERSFFASFGDLVSLTITDGQFHSVYLATLLPSTSYSTRAPP